MTQGADEAAANEALRAAGEDNLRDESPRLLSFQRELYMIIYSEPPP